MILLTRAHQPPEDLNESASGIAWALGYLKLPGDSNVSQG